MMIRSLTKANSRPSSGPDPMIKKGTPLSWEGCSRPLEGESDSAETCSSAGCAVKFGGSSDAEGAEACFSKKSMSRPISLWKSGSDRIGIPFLKAKSLIWAGNSSGRGMEAPRTNKGMRSGFRSRAAAISRRTKSDSSSSRRHPSRLQVRSQSEPITVKNTSQPATACRICWRKSTPRGIESTSLKMLSVPKRATSRS